DDAAVHPHGDPLAHRIEVGDDAGPHRLERVGVLGAPQRAVALLPRTLADVVAERVAEHAAERLPLGDVARAAADYGHQLALVLDRPRRILGDDDPLTTGDQRIDGAVADVGLGRRLRGNAVTAGPPVDVGAIVQTRRVEVPGRDGNELREIVRPTVDARGCPGLER